MHDVKFKGKSGQPLVIPNKVGETEAVSSPARKKMKLDTSLNTSVDPNNPRRAPVPCKFCGKIFSNVSNKERHERQSCKVSGQFVARRSILGLKLKIAETHLRARDKLEPNEHRFAFLELLSEPMISSLPTHSLNLEC